MLHRKKDIFEYHISFYNKLEMRLFHYHRVIFLLPDGYQHQIYFSTPKVITFHHSYPFVEITSFSISNFT